MVRKSMLVALILATQLPLHGGVLGSAFRSARGLVSPKTAQATGQTAQRLGLTATRQNPNAGLGLHAPFGTNCRHFSTRTPNFGPRGQQQGGWRNWNWDKFNSTTARNVGTFFSTGVLAYLEQRKSESQILPSKVQEILGDPIKNQILKDSIKTSEGFQKIVSLKDGPQVLFSLAQQDESLRSLIESQFLNLQNINELLTQNANKQYNLLLSNLLNADEDFKEKWLAHVDTIITTDPTAIDNLFYTNMPSELERLGYNENRLIGTAKKTILSSLRSFANTVEILLSNQLRQSPLLLAFFADPEVIAFEKENAPQLALLNTYKNGKSRGIQALATALEDGKLFQPGLQVDRKTKIFPYYQQLPTGPFNDFITRFAENLPEAIEKNPAIVDVVVGDMIYAAHNNPDLKTAPLLDAVFDEKNFGELTKTTPGEQLFISMFNSGNPLDAYTQQEIVPRLKAVLDKHPEHNELSVIKEIKRLRPGMI